MCKLGRRGRKEEERERKGVGSWGLCGDNPTIECTVLGKGTGNGRGGGEEVEGGSRDDV